MSRSSARTRPDRLSADFVPFRRRWTSGPDGIGAGNYRSRAAAQILDEGEGRDGPVARSDIHEKPLAVRGGVVVPVIVDAIDLLFRQGLPEASVQLARRVVAVA